MVIGGIQKFSLLDFPGRTACIIFTQGCNFRCPYCYNRSLVLPEYYTDPLPEEEVFRFLRKRMGLLEGVVITGGEPTVHPDLPGFIAKVKSMGYLVKLDTNGSSPEILKKLIDEKLIDFVAMDVKAPPERYQEVVRSEVNVRNVLMSIQLIKNSGIPYEFRTTAVKGFVDKEDLIKIGRLLKGADRYAIQRFVPADSLVDPTFSQMVPPPDKVLEETAYDLRKYIKEVEVR